MSSKYGGVPVQQSGSRFGGVPVEQTQTKQAQPEESYWDQVRGSLLGENGEDGLLKDTLDVSADFAGSFNKAVFQTADFLIPDQINAALDIAGSEKRVPTLMETVGQRTTQSNRMEPGLAQEIVKGAGNVTTAAGGMVSVPRNLAKSGAALAELAGFGSAAPTTANLSGKAAQKLALYRNTGDANTAKVMLDESGEVVTDKVGKQAAWQGFDDGFIAMIKAASPKARKNMAAMLNITEKGKKNYKYSAVFRPLDVLGRSVLDRIKVVRKANTIATRSLDRVAKNLRGEQVDASPAINDFLSSLDDMEIKFNPQNKTISFDASDIDELAGPQQAITRIINRMSKARNDGGLPPDAYEVHRLKRYIDEVVDYGKSEGGLSGKTKNVLKSLRHNLDGILDDNFPEYNQINTQYAETRGTMDALQDVAGKKMDFSGANSDKALGTLSRRLLSNAGSRVNLMDALAQLDDTAIKYANATSKDIVPYRKIMERTGMKMPDFDDGMIEQSMFADTLDRMFGAHSKTSLLGDVEKGVNKGVETASQGMGAAVIEGAKWAGKKAARINDDRAIKAMRELLLRGE